jgi:hypothetical protein
MQRCEEIKASGALLANNTDESECVYDVGI